MRRFFYKIIDDKVSPNIYQEFIFSLAMELDGVENLVKEDIVSIGMVIMENWLEKNIDKEQIASLKNNIDINKILKLMETKSSIIQNYYLTYEDSLGLDNVVIYFPHPTKSWIDEDALHVKIKVNLNRDLELGFCKIGFAYNLIDHKDGERKSLNIAYVSDDGNREVLRFGYCNPTLENHEILCCK